MSAKTRLLLDGLLFAVLLAAYQPGVTGVPFHEWLCLALFVPAIAHLVVNWDWCVRVVSSLGRRLRPTTRVNFVLDSGLFVAMVAAAVSGLMVSRVVAGVLGWTATTDILWYRIHASSADLTIALMGFHLFMHRRWVLRVVKTRFAAGGAKAALREKPVRVRSEGRAC